MDADMFGGGGFGKLASVGAVVPCRAYCEEHSWCQQSLLVLLDEGMTDVGKVENVCGELRVSGIWFSIASTGEPR